MMKAIFGYNRGGKKIKIILKILIKILLKKKKIKINI
jgi:hypothetical protein